MPTAFAMSSGCSTSTGIALPIAPGVSVAAAISASHRG